MPSAVRFIRFLGGIGFKDNSKRGEGEADH
jgi:hypothetical protein